MFIYHSAGFIGSYCRAYTSLPAMDPPPRAVDPTDSEETITADLEPAAKGAQFWLVIFSICLIGFTASLDGSIIAIAMPHISQDLELGGLYVPASNCFVFAQTVVQPGLAQLCDITGRRWPTIITIVLFAAGSAIAGAANGAGQMIAGRTIQGLGSGGIMLLVELVVCDMVPLRERSKYLGIVLSTASLGAIAGPVVGGALADWNWRWCFYLTVPICGVVLPVMVVYLRIKHLPFQWKSVLVQVDWIGNFVFIAAATSLLIGITFGGNMYPWSSWRIIMPIVLGVVGLVAFYGYEYWIRDSNPCVPPRVFGNRTSVAAFYMNFAISILLPWVCFFWPIYFLAVRGKTLLHTGIDFMPFMFFLVPGAAVVGVILAKTGRYRPLHAIGFALAILGPGLTVLLRKDSNAGVWAMFQIISALGCGIITPTTLPAILASLPESDVASATGMYSFLRSFGYVWGITIPTILFKSRFDAVSYRISDPAVRETLSGGRSYEFASGSYVRDLPQPVKNEVLDVYLEALKIVWYGAMALAATGLIAVLVEKHVPLRTNLETKFGLEEKKNNDKNQEASEKGTAGATTTQ
ncbi:hypothetical protein CDD82_2576 [Ophiocordyceps australis]|uniref:Major facilitator superfamily (MFS) profile domain-containing protein n=1 Tax=Ophiocordyceps australis TaxID=1399860 RepID=A0A2C5ZDN5_9HYPO|nr:hypothetical protein CDD82_2576 [Ophiocordyceps australis]